jgi:hypothetical protein
MITVLIAHRTNPLPLGKEMKWKCLHGRPLNVARDAEEARWGPLLERGEVEEVEGVLVVRELGPSASGVSLLVVVANSKVRRYRT